MANQNREFFNALMDEMLAFGVPIEGLHTETGPGVYEAAIGFSEALEQADRAILFKTGAKEIGSRFGIMPSFMAKWHQPLPGCSGHIHQSLSDGKPTCSTTRRAAQDEQALRKLPGRAGGLPDGVRAHVLAHHQQLQAAGGRFLGARQAHLGHGQPHGQLPRHCGVHPRRRGWRRAARAPTSTRTWRMRPLIAAGMYGVEKGLKLTTPPITGTNQWC
jgi:glutamine synthetase